jgi:tetratricopeptide (TPR) repeat protein
MVLLLATGVVSSGEPKQTDTQASMRGIFVALTTAYTFSLDPDAFAEPVNRRQILEALNALAENSGRLEAHGGGLDPSFEYLRRSLSRDARDAAQRYEVGNFMGARFVLSKITENCVTCHTKLPAERRFDLGAEFMETANVKELAPTARVNVEIATRQFDAALDTYEELLRSPDMTGDDLSLFGVFENYLKISVGALDDTERAIAALKEFAKRKDLPRNLTEDVQSWIGELEAWEIEKLEGLELATARDLIESAMKDTRSRSDRSRLVDFIASITLLHRFLRSDPDNDVDIAEAYYLLGVAESYVSRSYWISETDFLLEKAIRQAPGSDVAKKAFAFLEDYTRSEYRVTPARAVPPELQANLDELRELIGE